MALLIVGSPHAHAEDTAITFPEIKGKFGSEAEGYPISGDFIDYGGRIKVVLDEGILYRRPDTIHYDYYFLGRGRLDIIDTSALGVAWIDRFGDSTGIDFVSAYVCGRKFQELMGLDPSRWRGEKIKRQPWQKLQFKLTVPDRFYWVDLSGELNLWPEKDYFPLPVWVNLELEDGNEVVVYLTPDQSEQLNIYYKGLAFKNPFLLAGYDVSEILEVDPVTIDSSLTSVTLKETGSFDGISSIYITEGSENRGIGLNLPRLFKVDSVIDAGGQSVSFIKKKDRNSLYVSRRSVMAGMTDQITVYYRGKFLRPVYAGVDFPVNLTRWFPHLPYRTLGKFKTSYTLHKDLTLIAVGEKYEESIEGDQKTISYETDNISYVSFAAGVYDTLYDTANGIPISLYLRRESSEGIFNRDFPQTVLDDLSAACSTFTGWFGPPISGSLRLVDQQMSTGQSSPGLIHLSRYTFRTDKNQSQYRAHEMAHHWWGHTIIPKNFKDVWLSEGLAELSAALYVLNVKNDSAEYQEMVDYWRQQVIEEGKIDGLYSRGYRAGPILLGFRFLESYSPGDYIALVYYKAAYMLEMLRFEIDGPMYRTSFFNNLLAEFCRTYGGGQANSMDFIRVAGKYIGNQRAAKFFKQWLLDWKVPDFNCSYLIKHDDRGRPIVDLSIRISEVGDDFETPYPVEIEFEDGSRRLFRLDGIGRQRYHRLGPFPDQIKKIRFDPDHIILSRDMKITKFE
jgi:hypothetical protein